MTVQEFAQELMSWNVAGDIRFVNENDDEIDYVGISAVTFRAGCERITVAFNCESSSEKE